MLFFFCFKQKTAYEMRISDWSSDVCSSDLASDALYMPYAERQERDVAQMRRQQMLSLPSTLEYANIPGLSAELVGKLSTVRPANLDQASRIDGMTPAARPEERRVGKEWDSKCRTRWSPYH